MISIITMDQLNGSNSGNNESEQSRGTSNKSKSRVITKFTKRPPMQISTKENILNEESMSVAGISNAEKVPSFHSNELLFMNDTNASQTTEKADCLQTSLRNLEQSIPAKTNSLKEHNSDEDATINTLTPANKRLALLLKKIRQKTSPTASQTAQGRQQSHTTSEFRSEENSSSGRNQIPSDNFISLDNDNLQNTSNDWSLSHKIWPKNPIQHTSAQSFEPPQSAARNLQYAESSNQYSLHKPINSAYNNSTKEVDNNLTLHSSSQVETKANQSNEKPYQGRLSQLVQKFRNSPSVKSYHTPTTFESSNSFWNTDFSNSNKKTKINVCYNCNSSEHSFPACPQPQRRFCHRCGLNNVIVRNCPRCQDIQKSA